MCASVLPSWIQDLLEDPINRLAEEAQTSGRRAVGYTCSYVPEPILAVEGIFPLRMRAPGVAGTPLADTYLSSVICSYTRSLLEFALDGRYERLDGWVFTAGCDHLRRLYDNLQYLQKPSFIHIIDLPHKRGEPAVAWLKEEFRFLAEAVSRHFGVDAGTSSLQHAIAKQNEYLAVLREIGRLRQREAPALSGADFHALLLAAAVSPKDLLLNSLRELKEQLTASDGIQNYRARLMVVGSELDHPEYIAVMESLGAVVVADRFCLGSIPGLEPIPSGDDPLQLLAEYALNQRACPRMMTDFDSRTQNILQAVKDFRVDGVVLETIKFCDIWGVEASPLAAVLREAGLPVLKLEREYSMSGWGQLRTRVQAFLESMGK